MKSPLRELRKRVAARLRDAVAPLDSLARTGPAPMAPRAGDPPVVARLVVEIRSDGSHTVAQGAVEDAATGEKVGIRAEGATPTELAASLARSLVGVPLMAARASRSLRHAGPARPAPRPGDGDAPPGAPGAGAIDTEGTPTDDD